MSQRTICFVTGTRAEFGLMGSTLDAIRAHPGLRLQLVATGMHLDPAHGRTVDDIRSAGYAVDREIPWPRYGDAFEYAAATGIAIAELARAYRELQPEVVLVVGDRVEAFAAASAAHLAGLIVAHIHGGDRAQGQADDAMRHAITKLSHLHFAATPQSADRLRRLGEQEWRIHTAGAPGIDGITGNLDDIGNVTPFALLIYHPTCDDETAEFNAADRLLRATLDAGAPRIVLVHPNNDPGSRGIARRWDMIDDVRITVHRDVPRKRFLALMRDAFVLIGNSSAGIIEAASFGLAVVDVGPRQLGRERSGNVIHVEDDEYAIGSAIAVIWENGQPQRWAGQNVYGGNGACQRIADVLASTPLTPELRRKVIAY